MPLKEAPESERPKVSQVAPTIVPVRPLPDESVTVVPLICLKSYEAIAPVFWQVVPLPAGLQAMTPSRHESESAPSQSAPMPNPSSLVPLQSLSAPSQASTAVG
jgi:hypothetical protein